MWNQPLIQQNKRRARLLLYLSPLFIASVCLLIIHLAKDLGFDWAKVDFEEFESVQLLQEYLRIDTSYPTGSELAGAEWLARQFEAMGLRAHVEKVGDHHANMWAILDGEDPKALVLLNHIDTEPVLAPEKWNHPPFGAVIDGPFIFGRGSFDMKSVAIAQLMAMRAIVEEGRTPRRSLMFLATGDEERGSRLGVQRWIQRHPDLFERVGAVLTEGGTVEALSLDTVKYWGTEYGQKYFIDMTVCDASAERLALLRAQLLQETDGVLREPSPEVADFFRAYAPSRERPEFQTLLAQPETMLESPEFAVASKRMLAWLRNSFVISPIMPNPEGGFQFHMILHLLPGTTFEEGWEELFPGDLFGFEYSIDIQHPPVEFSPLDHEIYRTIDAYMAEVRPKAPHGPMLVPWSSTDSRFFRVHGIPAYGFSPFHILTGDAVGMRGDDERMALVPFIEGVELYQGLVERLVFGE